MNEKTVETNGQADEDTSLRIQLREMLESGLQTEIEPRAYSDEEITAIVARLQQIDANRIEDKLKIAGFTLTPYGTGEDEQACETCMYYQVHRRFCELPELMLPVEAEWSCRLWRI